MRSFQVPTNIFYRVRFFKKYFRKLCSYRNCVGFRCLMLWCLFQNFDLLLHRVSTKCWMIGCHRTLQFTKNSVFLCKYLLINRKYLIHFSVSYYMLKFSIMNTVHIITIHPFPIIIIHIRICISLPWFLSFILFYIV